LENNRVIALGFFDGVHIGHGALLRLTRERASALGCTASALTFDAHPDTVIFGTPMPLIGTMDDRKRLMRELYGIDEVLVAHFDHAMMTMPWRTFVTDELAGRLRARAVVCGHDFRFGFRGEGTPERLREACRERGIGCDVVPKVMLDGEVVSSTRIRELLTKGELAEAIRFLGHAPAYTGRVAHGQHLGTGLGVPTANLPFPEGILVPACGVYAASVLAGGTRYPAVANVGVHPTAGAAAAPVLETWLFGYEGDLYGQTVTAELHEFLRPERKFPSMEALREQILRDAARAKELTRE